MSALDYLLAIVAGGVGAGLRYVVDGLVMRGRKDAFPLGIVVVNVTGSFALGLLTGLGGAVGPDWLTIAGVGLLGGYTTFSTVSVEVALLAQERRRGWAWANLAGTVVLAVAAAAAGLALGRVFG